MYLCPGCQKRVEGTWSESDYVERGAEAFLCAACRENLKVKERLTQTRVRRWAGVRFWPRQTLHEQAGIVGGKRLGFRLGRSL